jgi:hypothetical protein
MRSRVPLYESPERDAQALPPKACRWRGVTIGHHRSKVYADDDPMVANFANAAQYQVIALGAKSYNDRYGNRRCSQLK